MCDSFRLISFRGLPDLETLSYPSTAQLFATFAPQIIKKSSINHHGFSSVYLIQFTPILALLLMSIPALIDNGEMVTKLLNYRVFWAISLFCENLKI
ncbi:hypothetical protein BpHYR1_023217 [Brachionus plicatilis]|uniref:Uncharacterized protein n=1 Tax=Brachionus plicatilis TaxID=10195 RepID=A0A3M7PKC6_BRAPC|nr:hypothetical protein BpHYR1_023217 [Brachionus plicatilis]